MNTNISFGAKFIQKMPIKKYSYIDKTYTPTYANLVELNPSNIRDVKALDKIAMHFGSDSYVNNMALHAKRAYKHSKKNEDAPIFIVLDKAVTCAAEIHKIRKKETEIIYLQTDPNLVYSYIPRAFKNIGTSIIQYLQQINNRITLRANSSSMRFYKKHGFKMVSQDSYQMEWIKKAEK